jgi:hypothetical protein
MNEALPAVIGGLLGVITSAVAAVLTYRLANRQREQSKVLGQEYEELFREEAAQRLSKRPSFWRTTDLKWEDLLTFSRVYITGRDTPPSRAEIRREVEAAITALQGRLEQIEQRFPEEATLEKIATVNDAILATKIEQLEKSIENLESKLLTKWDVATIVFAVFAAIGGVAGVIFAVANFVLK